MFIIPAVFPAAADLVRGRRTQAERRSPTTTYRFSSSGCSAGASPGSSPPPQDLQDPDRSPYWTPRQQASCWAPGCPIETLRPPWPRYCWSLRAARTLVTPRTHSTPLLKRKSGEILKRAWMRSKLEMNSLQWKKPMLTHFIQAGEASSHGCMFGGFAQIWCAGRPNFASLTQWFQPANREIFPTTIKIHF